MTAMPAVAADATRTFLQRHAPFSGLSAAALDFLVPRLARAEFAADGTILATRSGPVTHLHIVERGLVASRPDNVQAAPERTLGPGELFPVGALSAGGSTTKVFTALAPTTCLLLARADFLALRQLSPEFERYCTQAITETLRQSLESLYRQYSQRASEQQLLTRPLADLVRHAPVACPASASLSEAARRMADAKVRTIIALDADGAPVGMFTLVDLLRRVVLPQLPLGTPLSAVMTSPVVMLPATASASEGMHTMAERGVRQLVVVENGRLVGVVNERDLFALQRVSMRQVNQDVEDASSVETLRRAADDIRRLTQNLLAQGVAAEPLTRTIASLNDALSRRTIELALARHDLASVDWCWLALGSEGRSEQTFATDQDNAIVFAAGDAAAAEGLRARLIAFARDVNADLDRLGFPLCPGNVMAGNPEFCLSIEEWKRRFLAWIREPTPQSLLGANIVFDFRALYGNSALADGLRGWLLGYTQANAAFLRLMVQNALQVEPPLGLIRAFVIDDDANGRGTLDLKTRGTRLFVDCARVFALAQGIADPGTAARLRTAGEALHAEPRHVAATVEAFQFLQLLRLRRQDQPAPGADPNRVDPYALNEVDQRMLKEAFRQAKQLQDRLRMSYRL
jgi:CBS domain-containing protein